MKIEEYLGIQDRLEWSAEDVVVAGIGMASGALYLEKKFSRLCQNLGALASCWIIGGGIGSLGACLLKKGVFQPGYTLLKCSLQT